MGHIVITWSSTFWKFSQCTEPGNCKYIFQYSLKELSMFWLRKVLVFWTWNHHVLSIYWLSTGGFVPSESQPTPLRRFAILLWSSQSLSILLHCDTTQLRRVWPRPRRPSILWHSSSRQGIRSHQPKTRRFKGGRPHDQEGPWRSKTQLDLRGIGLPSVPVALGAEGVLPGRHIVSLLRVFKQFTHLIPSGQMLSSFKTYSPLWSQCALWVSFECVLKEPVNIPIRQLFERIPRVLSQFGLNGPATNLSHSLRVLSKCTHQFD